ncbi:MAG: heme-binding domain-containing protein [Prolixibacteraceae bacterium]|nr:heme-binding domain-containing protein [Prolixibacteraceae bacterium]
MKKFGLFAATLFAFLFSASVLVASDKTPVKGELTMPENIKAIVDKSCFGCHNTDSQNEDAKEELDFKTFDTLSKVKKVGALRHIAEVVEEGEMPPKRFLERFPDRKLTEEEAKVLTEWVKKEAEALIAQ